MKISALTVPEVAIIAGTRVMAGAGAALLLADRINDPAASSRVSRTTSGASL